MRTLYLLLFIAMISSSPDALAQIKKHHPRKKVHYEEMYLEDMIRRYYEKETGPNNAIEGIYSVSCMITKRSKEFLTGYERERVLERKDNYARVAILKDRPQSKRDYIEISLSYHDAGKYPVMGDFAVLSEGRGFIYNHLEPDGTTLSFSMKDDTDLIEGEYSFMSGRRTITYKLSYLKIYPKATQVTTNTAAFPN